jgi:hypothetical protein
MSVGSHETSLGELENAHSKCSENKELAPRKPIDEDQCGESHDHVDNVLDGSREECAVAGQASHLGWISLYQVLKSQNTYLEDINNVVHHGIGSSHLGPDVREDCAVNTNDIARVEKLEPRQALVLPFLPSQQRQSVQFEAILLSHLLNLVANLLCLSDHNRIKCVALGMEP